MQTSWLLPYLTCWSQWGNNNKQIHFLSSMLFCDKFNFHLLKFSHYLIKPCHEGIYGRSGGTAPFDLILGIRWDQPILCLGCFTPHIHWIGSWVGQTAGPDALERNKNMWPLTTNWTKMPLSSSPYASHYTDWAIMVHISSAQKLKLLILKVHWRSPWIATGKQWCRLSPQHIPQCVRWGRAGQGRRKHTEH